VFNVYLVRTRHRIVIYLPSAGGIFFLIFFNKICRSAENHHHELQQPYVVQGKRSGSVELREFSPTRIRRPSARRRPVAERFRHRFLHGIPEHRSVQEQSQGVFYQPGNRAVHKGVQRRRHRRVPRPAG